MKRKINKKECEKCGAFFHPGILKRHLKYCGNKKRIPGFKLDFSLLKENGKYECPFCKKEYSKMGISTHIWRNHTEEGKIFKPREPGYIGPNKGKKLSEEWKAKISKSGEGRKISAETRKKLSIALKGKTGGLKKGGGRSKKGNYKGYWCDSSWELAYIIYCLDKNIGIKRNRKGFEYIFENKKYKFYPDFLREDGVFIEIKGYMGTKNLAKINQFNDKLEVIDKNGIYPFLEYVIQKYGKDFIKLYETASTSAL